MAERQGFEPWIEVMPLYSLSRRAPSASSATSPYFYFLLFSRRMRDSNPQARRAAVFKTADLPVSLILLIIFNSYTPCPWPEGRPDSNRDDLPVSLILQIILNSYIPSPYHEGRPDSNRDDLPVSLILLVIFNFYTPALGPKGNPIQSRWFTSSPVFKNAFTYYM